jgi:hypothetical protein
MRRIFGDLVLGAHNLTEAVVILRLWSFFGAGHSLVAGCHQLSRILLPSVQRLLLFAMGKLLIF